MTKAGLLYLLTAGLLAISTLTATITVYLIWRREVPEILSDSIVNTAAVLAAFAFVGALEMFFTMQQRRQHEAEHRQWMAMLEKQREEDNARRAEDAARIERQRQEDVARRAEDAARMERMFDTMLARFLESIERIDRRNNGNGTSRPSDDS